MTPDQLALDYPVINSVRMVQVPIRVGEFQMGSPESKSGHRSDKNGDETLHQMGITNPFYLSACEVIQEKHKRQWVRT